MLKLNCNCDDSERRIKNIYAFVNGAKYSGQKIVLSQNRWHHILNQITVKLDPYFGKVEKLYSTSSGVTVCSFTDLQNNAAYVASDRARKCCQVKGGYTVDNEPTQEYFEHYLSSQLQRVNKFKKLVYVRRDLLVIYIFRNGECGQSFKIVLTSEDLSSWSHILSYVALIIDVPERCIKSLYSVSGNRICGPWELQHGASYVAVGYNENFRKGCYRVAQKTTEIVTTGFPVVPKDKNLACAHKGKRKMKQAFRWNHYDQYMCTPPSKKSSRKSRSSSKKSKPGSSQSEPGDKESEPGENEAEPGEKESEPGEKESGPAGKESGPAGKQSGPADKESELTKRVVPEGSENKKHKKNKKVTVHMRIEKAQASNLTITRTAGSNGKKHWIEDSSDSDNAHSNMCTSPETCTPPNEKEQYQYKYQSEPSSPTFSDENIQTDRNLTWKHVKKSESEKKGRNSEKVTVQVRGGGKAVIVGDDSSSESLHKSKLLATKKKRGSEDKAITTFAVKEKTKKYSADYTEKHAAKEKTKKNSSDYTEKHAAKEKTKKNSSDYTEKHADKKCRTYNFLKPAMDEYKPSYCPNTPASAKPKAKYNNTILKLNRDQSESRIKNLNCKMACKDAAKCKTDKRISFLEQVHSILCDSMSSIDSLKSRPKRAETEYHTDSEDSYGYKDEEESRNHSPNKSSCTICRTQKERRHI